MKSTAVNPRAFFILTRNILSAFIYLHFLKPPGVNPLPLSQAVQSGQLDRKQIFLTFQLAYTPQSTLHYNPLNLSTASRFESSFGIASPRGRRPEHRGLSRNKCLAHSAPTNTPKRNRSREIGTIPLEPAAVTGNGRISPGNIKRVTSPSPLSRPIGIRSFASIEPQAFGGVNTGPTGQIIPLLQQQESQATSGGNPPR